MVIFPSFYLLGMEAGPLTPHLHLKAEKGALVVRKGFVCLFINFTGPGTSGLQEASVLTSTVLGEESR